MNTTTIDQLIGAEQEVLMATAIKKIFLEEISDRTCFAVGHHLLQLNQLESYLLFQKKAAWFIANSELSIDKLLVVTERELASR